LAFCLWASVISRPAFSAQLKATRYTSKYDDQIQAAAKRWLPLYPSWKRGKAQLIAESNLDPNACSQVGACGLGQFMPGTWADVVAQMKWDGNVSRHDAKHGIEAWAYYQGRLYMTWKANRPQEDRVSLAESSYNAGLGWILRAQKLCTVKTGSGCALWDEVMKFLPEITGHHSKETIGYTQRIRRVWADLERGL
jgi:membrane-bound lytic murein transglycosylase MltF